MTKLWTICMSRWDTFRNVYRPQQDQVKSSSDSFPSFLSLSFFKKGLLRTKCKLWTDGYSLHRHQRWVSEDGILSASCYSSICQPILQNCPIRSVSSIFCGEGNPQISPDPSSAFMIWITHQKGVLILLVPFCFFTGEGRAIQIGCFFLTGLSSIVL